MFARWFPIQRYLDARRDRADPEQYFEQHGKCRTETCGVIC